MHPSLKNDLSLRHIIIAASLVMLAINLHLFAVLAASPDTALPFSVTTTDLQWVASGYMIALASCLVLGDQLADLLCRRTWLFIGAAVFGLASFIFSINKAADWDSTPPYPQVAIASALLGIVVLVIVERYVSYPLIDLGLFKISKFSVMTITGLLSAVLVLIVTLLGKTKAGAEDRQVT
ncbi:MAG: hypothetical protein OSA77_01610 [Halioglobus sp.]|nr:hypothetical protein [Halioglobus sp.]